MASVEWSDDALGDLEKIDTSIARRIVAKAVWLSVHFSETTPERLHGTFGGLYKLRVGDYRLIYSIHGEHATIEAVRHRSDAYKS